MSGNRYSMREAFSITTAFAISIGGILLTEVYGVEAVAIVPTQKTVTWYANNGPARARQQLACLDDPGRLRSTPDCINAEAASVTVALRQTRNRVGELDARKPAFWSEDPKNRYNKLLVCSHNPQLTNCDVARRSLELEAKGR